MAASSQEMTSLGECDGDSLRQTMRVNQNVGFEEVHRFLSSLFEGDLHAKRILSLSNATLGVIKTASLAVNTIGQGLSLWREG